MRSFQERTAQRRVYSHPSLTRVALVDVLARVRDLLPGAVGPAAGGDTAMNGSAAFVLHAEGYVGGLSSLQDTLKQSALQSHVETPQASASALMVTQPVGSPVRVRLLLDPPASRGENRLPGNDPIASAVHWRIRRATEPAQIVRALQAIFALGSQPSDSISAPAIQGRELNNAP